jgi:hypothetical protein
MILYELKHYINQFYHFSIRINFSKEIKLLFKSAFGFNSKNKPVSFKNINFVSIK